MTVRARAGDSKPVIHDFEANRRPDIHTDRAAIAHVLGRAYPLLKQAAEILELEAEFDRDVAMLATDTKRIRRAVGELLARSGSPVNPDPFFKEKDG